MENYLTKQNCIEILKQRKKELESCISVRQKSLKNAPPGNLKISRKKNSYQYYDRSGYDTTGTYLRKKNLPRILSLAQKKYDSDFIKAAEAELSSIEDFLNSYSPQTDLLYDKYPAELTSKLNLSCIPDELYIKYWLYEMSLRKAEEIKDQSHITFNGEIVRSKSEELIANTLFKMKIPYVYEHEVVLFNKKRIHPDFTILDIKRRRTIYYEHFGKMHDPEYVNYNLSRLSDMARSGIVTGKNLIITMETLDTPLNSRMVEETIRNALDLKN